MQITKLCKRAIAPCVSTAVVGSKSVRFANRGNANGRLASIDPPINRQIVPSKRRRSGKFNAETFHEQRGKTVHASLTNAAEAS
jgi:hypothetical protein